jgi:hypothetical protein
MQPERFKNKSEIKVVRAVEGLARSGRIDPHPESLGGYGRAILQAGL